MIIFLFSRVYFIESRLFILIIFLFYLWQSLLHTELNNFNIANINSPTKVMQIEVVFFGFLNSDIGLLHIIWNLTHLCILMWNVRWSQLLITPQRSFQSPFTSAQIWTQNQHLMQTQLLQCLLNSNSFV